MTSAYRILHVPRPSQLFNHVSSRLRTLDMDIEEVREVLSQFGLKFVRPPRNLPAGRRNQNVIVETPAGKKMLKRYRPQWQVGTVVYGHSIITRLAELNFQAPRLVTALDGETYVSRQGYLYALLDFVGGTNYSSNFLLRAQRRQLMALAGQTMACFHRELKGFMPQGQHHMGFSSYTGKRWRDMAWHTEKIADLKEKSRQLTEPEDKAHADWLVQNSNMILEELGRLDEALNTASLSRTIIHGDYGLHNLLFQKDGRVTPVDFELSRLEWRLSDLVSCLSRFRYGEGEYDFESIQRFVAAYQVEFPFSADEWRFFPVVWQFYKLQSAVQYWNSYFETGGPIRKLISARDAMNQVDWAFHHPDKLLGLNAQVKASLGPGSKGFDRISDVNSG